MQETTFIDDRTDEQSGTHWVGVAASDRVLSGHGGATDGESVAVWACKPDDIDTVEEWVDGRCDTDNVRQVDLDLFDPDCAHCHIYVVGPGHPALVAA